MPFVSLPHFGLRAHVQINHSSPDPGHADDAADPRSFLHPSKPHIVLLHAAVTSSALDFAQWFANPRLAAQFNLIGLDSRFCGRTESESKARHAMEDNGPDALAVLDALGLNEWSVVGSSLVGATAAAWLAVLAPERTRAVVLVGPNALEAPPAIRDSMINDWLPLAISNKDGRGDGSGRIPDECMPMVRDWAFHGAGEMHLAKVQDFVDGILTRYGPGQPAEDISHMAIYFNYAPIPPDKLAGITCPVLILQGEKDIYTSPLEAAQAWQESLPNAKGGAAIHVVAGAPHLMAYFEPGVTARIVQQFVTRSLA